MNEETKTEATKEELAKTETEKLILGKFKDVEALTKSYVELESKLGAEVDVASLSDEDLIAHNKKVFSVLIDKESSLDGNLKTLAEEYRDKFGLPTKLADAIAAGITRKNLEKHQQEVKDKIVEKLSDKENKLAFESYVKTQDEVGKKDIEARLNSGELSEGEVSLIVKLGKKIDRESPDALGLLELSTTGSEKSLMNEYMGIIRNQSAVWTNPKHPEYLKVTKRKLALKRHLKLI